MDFWGVLLLIVAFALMVYVMYALCIAIPMDMARDRHRDPVLWLIVSFLCSPFVAIFSCGFWGTSHQKTKNLGQKK
jgi:hypothetical protein